MGLKKSRGWKKHISPEFKVASKRPRTIRAKRIAKYFEQKQPRSASKRPAALGASEKNDHITYK